MPAARPRTCWPRSGSTGPTCSPRAATARPSWSPPTTTPTSRTACCTRRSGTSPRGFKRRRPNGHRGWTWNLGDTRLVLYRLPRVLAAVEAGELVYVVEGEKDVHAIEAAGATATTVIGGVNGRWLPEFSRLLAKTRVVVVADDDQPGRKRAAATARAIARLGGQVEVVKPAVGKDAA